MFARHADHSWSGSDSTFIAAHTVADRSFFSVLIPLIGVFVWQWGELSNRTDREAILGFFTGQGFIALELKSTDVSVEFNGRPVEVASDSRVLIRLKHAGSYVYRSFTADGGPSMNGEFLIHAGIGATVKLPGDAQRVVVTGPIRGKLTPP